MNSPRHDNPCFDCRALADCDARVIDGEAACALAAAMAVDATEADGDNHTPRLARGEEER